MKALISIFAALTLPAVQADETAYTIEPIIFSGKASFETLSEETVVPKKSKDVEQSRFSLIKDLAGGEGFPAANLGFPGGASGVKLGGRSIEDTQVSTLGVPLNLPQGGGADLSIFPSFLWSRADFAPTPIASGYAPTSASGSIDLKLWTREQILKPYKSSKPQNRVTGSYDRQVQNFSLASRQQNIAINAGMNFGLQTGPAGSLSYEFYRDSIQTWRLHFIGTDQEADSPGSKSSPTSGAKLKNWRMIPILETQRSLGDDWIWESTEFADLSGLTYDSPTPGSSSTSRTQQYGTENAFTVDDYTIALSARYEHYEAANARADEFPMLGSLSKLFRLSKNSEFKATAQVSAINTLGAAPGGRLGWKSGAYFAELFTTAKMPTLTARYYQDALFHPNVNLKTERIYSAVIGREGTLGELQSKTSLKGEHRTDVQITSILSPVTFESTVINSGAADLVYLEQEWKWEATGRLTLTNIWLFSYSKMQNNDLPYPDLSAVTIKGRAGYRFSPMLSLEGRGQYQGPSVAAAYPNNGRFHPNYALFDAELRVTASNDVQFQAGIENLTDNRAEVVLDYPLPGRMVYLGMQIAL